MSEQPPVAYYVPPRTAQAIQKHSDQCTNLALLLDKYVEREVIDDNKLKGDWLRKIIRTNMVDAGLAQNVYRRWQLMMKSLNVEPFDMDLDWRMIIGLGGASVLETDITLHHLYGIPTIPASALKGLTRAYAAAEEKVYFVPVDKPEAERKPSLDEKTDHPDIQRIFGTQNKAGTVIFFDALPLDGQATFVLDIINPHYPDYYNTLKSSSITPPDNTQSPKPIQFLTVANTTFTFAIAPRNPNDASHKDDVEEVRKLLLKALQKYGVGGKTSAGYGYFLPPQQEETPSPTAQKPESLPYIRPSIPSFNAGQGISSLTVVAPTDELRRKAPEVKAFLRYREFSTKLVLVVVEAEEAASWTVGQTKNCMFVREEERDGCTVLICQPGASKKKKG